MRKNKIGSVNYLLEKQIIKMFFFKEIIPQ